MDKRQRTRLAQAIKVAIRTQFPEVTQKLVDQAVYLAEDDPGQWAERSLIVIHTEDGIPNPSYANTSVLDAWFYLDEALQKSGWNVYHECINGGVMACYPV